MQMCANDDGLIAKCIVKTVITLNCAKIFVHFKELL